MNKKRNSMIIGFLLLLVVVGAHSVQINAQNKIAPIKAVIFAAQPNGVSSTISYVAENLDKRLAGDEIVRCSSYIVDVNSYRDLDYKVDMAVDLNADVLILSGSSVRDTTALQRLKDAGIRLIFVDGDDPQCGRDAYVGTDNLEAGKLAAQTVLEEIGSGNAAILSVPQVVSNKTRSKEQRKSGILSYLEKKNSTIEILAEKQCSSENFLAKTEIKELLETNPQINALFCLDSASGVAAALALKELHRTEDVYVICFDLPDQVEDELTTGGIDAAVVQNFDECGRICADLLREIALDPDSITNRIEIVDCQIITAKDIG